jgi:hypothetical protein
MQGNSNIKKNNYVRIDTALQTPFDDKDEGIFSPIVVGLRQKQDKHTVHSPSQNNPDIFHCLTVHFDSLSFIHTKVKVRTCMSWCE